MNFGCFCIDLIINYTSNFFFLILPFNVTIIASIKFSLVIVLLILIRAGLPRYRYDFLTILGWSRFLVISLFFILFYTFFYSPCILNNFGTINFANLYVIVAQKN